MNTELLGVIATYALTLIIAYTFGEVYLQSFQRGKGPELGFLAPVERFIYKICGINPKKK